MTQETIRFIDGLQAIETYMLPCTNTRPYRIVAKCAAKKRVYSQPIEAMGTLQTHKWAAMKLLKELNWEYRSLNSGVLVNGHYVHAMTARDYSA